ncbi:MAG: YceI family protein [Lysobacterales bacterium]
MLNRPAPLLAGLLCLALCPTVARPASAAPATEAVPPSWRIESALSHCEFSLRALRWFKVSGRFTRIEGEVSPVLNTHLASIRVPIESVRMASEGRRKWAMSEEFFDAARFPDLRFEAELDRIDRDALRRPIQGILELRGIRGTVTLQVKSVDCDDQSRRCAVTAESTVSRQQFGMRSQRMLLGDSVRLRLHLVLVQMAADATPGPGS